jgi:hypothetical protein
MKNSAAVTKLEAHIKGLGMSRCGWAKEHGYPLPVITRFLKGERAVSFCTVARLIKDSGGALCWEDFLQGDETRDAAGLCAGATS